MIFCLMRRSEWESLADDVVAAPGPEGFVHCCAEQQIDFVRRTYFPPGDDVVALGVDPTTLDSETRFEPGSGGEPERFPHVYGSITKAAVVDVRPL